MSRFWLVLLLLALPAMAADFRPFGHDSRAAIARAHLGKPFVLAFWSVDCAYCAEEIRQLDILVREHPGIDVVLVCTDGAEMAGQAADMLAHSLPAVREERWMFEGGDADRLYFAVDRKWRGELPRAYFYDAAGKARVVAGQVDRHWLKEWAQGIATSNHK